MMQACRIIANFQITLASVRFPYSISPIPAKSGWPGRKRNTTFVVFCGNENLPVLPETPATTERKTKF